ncbi:hypothetical protein PHYSODRAFT_301057 [Phytophthora sojae]|uniref:Uncharacterized protein n=1 Tax=Phytophthora sojae (strain P6497) TaxID=1094619 RepID=G4ZDM2_PHYSP|nr:hypothetical protein PHYSODRAFT_301057 [Phytophthora sojae]EGZ18361.1 hypothetical protein PHYSODRAFT_301057 [Phytophthora sojae]|eukprot:XP_009527419.1 hypothetical protein PHYSODRAFT_301057 [Phytophthora sojae]
MNDPELLRIVCRVLPTELLAIVHIPELVNTFLLPATIDSAVYNDLVGVIQAYGCSRPWTVAAMDGAATRGRLDIVHWLYAHRCGGCSTAAFLGAASHGHLDVLKWLHNFYPMLCDSEKEQVLAAEYGHVGVVRFLLPGRRAREVKACLVAAAANGHVQVMEAVFPWPVDMTQCLVAAAAKDHLEVLRLLLDRGYNDQIRYVGPALRDAVAAGQVNSIQFLLDKCDDFGVRSALGTAVESGRTAVVEQILGRCSPDEVPIGRELKKAAQRNQCEIVQLLLAKRAHARLGLTKEIQAAIDVAFLDAVKHGRIDIVKALADSSGFSVTDALRHAERRRQWEIVKMLLDFARMEGSI